MNGISMWPTVYLTSHEPMSKVKTHVCVVKQEITYTESVV